MGPVWPGGAMSEVVPLAGAKDAAARPRFHHVILTRFNVRFVEDPRIASIGLDPAWLTDRFALFERYCLPSVVAQSVQNFSWILFFDSATPPDFVEKIKELIRPYDNVHAFFSSKLPISTVQDAVRSVVPANAEWLLTTRLDNDDALHVDFVASVQAGQTFRRAEVLNFPLGIILSQGRAYRWRDQSNAFISLSEPFDGFATVLNIYRHVYAHESYPVRQVADAPMWLQLVHDNNVSNRIRGFRLPVRRALSGFPASAIPQNAADRSFDIILENITISPLRWMRNTAITSARLAAKQFGFDLRRKAQPKHAR
jgi:hypothetical protein